MNYSDIAFEMAAHIRSVVRPLIGTPESREVTGTAFSGDATFSIDDVAEDAVVGFIRERGLNLAYYTEDAGLRSFGSPEATLIIDPVDGSRGAIAGFECCVVSVAVADYKKDVRFKDVRAGCIYEIKSDRAFIAQRKCGAVIIENGKEVRPRRSNVELIEQAGWTAEVAGRPAAAVAKVLGEAIDASSIRGGFFILNSTAYSLTRLVSGQLSAVVDVGGRLAREFPHLRTAFLEAGGGTVMGLFPYDFAAAALIALEAGCIVTDAAGHSLDEVDVLDSSEANIQSILAAGTPALHKRFLASIEHGLQGLRDVRQLD